MTLIKRSLLLILLSCVLGAVVGLIVVVADADGQTPKKAPCTLAVADSPAQARIQATCVAAARSLDRGEGYTVRVESDACRHYRGVTYRCRASGHSGISPCGLVIRVRGTSRNPARLWTRVTFRSCAPS